MSGDGVAAAVTVWLRENVEMDESEFMEKAMSMWPSGDESAIEALAIAREGLRMYPCSAKLLCIVGDLLQLRDATDDAIVESRRCYQNAIASDLSCSEAYESLGYLSDVYDNNFLLAISYFEKAIGLGAGEWSYVGLARSLAQDGRREEALHALCPDRCPFHDKAPVSEMREEILAGAWD